MHVGSRLDAAALEILAADPVTGLLNGRIYKNSVTNETRIYDGTVWRPLVTTTDTQTLTNKTLTTPVISSPTGLVKADVGLSNVDNTSDATKNSAAVTLTNKTLTAPVINSPTGIVKADVGLGNVDNTSDATKNAATVTLTNKTLTAPVINSPTGIVKGDVGLGNVDNTSNATERAVTATLTNKTIDGNNNTLTVLAGTQLSGQVPIANGGTGQSTANTAFNALSPNTTKGDISVRNATVNTRLAVGTVDGQVLTVDAASAEGIKWSDGGAGGSGEINAVSNPSAASATTGWTNGTSHTISRVTSGSPLAPITATAFSISATANATESSTSGDYYSISALAPGLQNRKLKVEFYYTAATAADTWVISVYAGATRQSLSTDASGVTTIPAGVTGQKFTTTFDTSSATAYTVNITRTAGSGTTTFVLTNLIVGPGIQPQGAVVGPWLSYTPVVLGFGTPTISFAQWRRVGSTMEFRGYLTTGTVTGVSAAISIPTGYTIATSTPTSVVGQALVANSLDIALTVDTAINTGFVFFGNPGAANPFTFVLGTAFGNTKGVGFKGAVNINEWAGSGTVNLVQNDVEWAADDGTSDVFGPNGALVPSVAFAAGTTSRDFVFATPPSVTDAYVVELMESTSIPNWTPAASYYPFTRGNNNANNSYGVRGNWTSTTTYAVTFGNRGNRVDLSLTDNGTSAWSSLNTAGMRFRVRKIAGGNAVGFGLATTTSAGLVSPYTTNGVVYAGTYTPTLTVLNNLDTITTPGTWHFTRVGNIVSVSGEFTADPVAGGAGTATSFYATVPVARTGNFVNTYDASGVASWQPTNSNTIYNAGNVLSNSGVDQRVIVLWSSSGTTSRRGNVTFTYTLN